MSKNFRSAEETFELLILDVLKYGAGELIPDILKLLNNDACIGWKFYMGRDFSIDDIIPIVERLIEKKEVSCCVYSEEKERLEEVPFIRESAEKIEYVFVMTDSGQERLDNWEDPPIDPKYA